MATIAEGAASMETNVPITPKGRIYPNLVIIFDSGKKEAEFRVQCEVPFSFEEARSIQDTLFEAHRSRAALERISNMVVERAREGGATEKFQEVIKEAFAAQPELVK